MTQKARPPKRPTSRAIRVDDTMLAELREIAERESRPMANLVVALVKEALEARRGKQAA